MSNPPESPSRSLLPGAAAFLSVLLAALVAMARPWGLLHGLSLALSAVTVLAALRAWRTDHRRPGTAVLLALSLQVAVFLASVAGTPALTRFRLIQAGAVVAYVALMVSAVLVRRGHAPARAAMVGATVAVGLLAFDAFLGLGAPPRRLASRVDWPDSSDAHPSLGRVPRPYATFKTYYPDDRRGYLTGEDLRARTWELNVMPGSVAELMLPPEDPELLRVAIRQANPDTTWHVQLFHSRFAVQAQLPYFISFRARADRPRKAWVGFTQHHPPWSSLGLYQEIDLSPAWKSFREVFVPRRPDTNSMIVFHLAGSDAPVELAAVRLHGPPSGRTLDPIFEGVRYSIEHRRNALGCRDQDYVTRPDRTVRILVLGDAFTAGVGVHEKDTFSSRVERELNGGAAGRPNGPAYEVINCGVSGYGTREQRLFFELFGATYRPDLVLVTMGWNDDRFYWAERQAALLERGPGRLEQLSSVLRKIEVSRRLRRSYDYTRSLDDLLALGKAASAQGAQLIVAVSRYGPPGLGDSLLATVKEGLAGSKIPLLDLGTLPTDDSVGADPRAPAGPQAHGEAALRLLRWLREDVLASPKLPTTAP